MIAHQPETTNKQVKNALQERPLGNIALSSSASVISAKQKTRHDDYKLLSEAQRILIDKNVLSPRSGNGHRTRYCQTRRTFQADNITLKLNGNDIQSEASIGNVQTCGSVWSCPICAKREAVKKGKLVKTAIAYADEHNLIPVMVALTAQHELNTPLKEFKNAFKRAWVSFTSRRRWRNFKRTYGLKHYIANTEVTHGQAGWHYHKHILLFFDAVEMKYAEDDNSLEETLRQLWLDCLSKQGLGGIGEHALKVSAHKNVGANYLTKIGLTEDSKTGELHYELTGSMNKKSGKTIWDILRHARYGDKQSERLYIEFVQAMFGDSFISFSDGFLPLLEDFELPAEDEKEDSKKEWAEIAPYWWQVVVRNRSYGRLLDCAARTRSIEEVRQFLFILQDELIEQKKLPDYHRAYRTIAASSEDNIICIREVLQCDILQ